MKKITTLIILFLPFITMAQWITRQSLNVSDKRTFATAFSLNGNTYVVGGNASSVPLADVWEYNPLTDTWLQKNNFPGSPRGGATAFTIGGKAYYMCGSNYTNQYFSDLWEYDPATDQWAQKSGFPGGGRQEAIGFAIGNKGYFGTGWFESFNPNSTTWGAYSDFWEYNPTTDTWAPKAQMPGAQRGWAVATALGGKGYAGLGGNGNQNGSFNDFYEYDPLADTWTAKASYAASVADAMIFTLNNEIYVCGGVNFGTNGAYNITRKYMPATDTWSAEAPMPAGATMGAVAVTVGNRAFVGTGYDVNMHERSNWLEFATATSTLCQNAMAFTTATFATNGTAQCDGKVVISNITNGCAPYTFSIAPNSGTVTAGAGGFTVSGLCDATYSVYVADANCCGTTMAVCKVPGNMATGILNYNAAQAGFAIWPSPNNGQFEIAFNANSTVKETDILLVNCLGQEVPVSIVKHGHTFTIELAERKAGIYFLQAVYEGKMISKKVQVE